MYISLELLKNFIDIRPDLTPEEIAERLTFSGSEVENINYCAGKMSGVIVARVQELEEHPEEPKLLIASLNTGSGEHTCITSAHNIKKGDLVFYAGAGAILPNGIEMGIKDFKGVSSSGMMLSAEELGLKEADDPSGLLVLPPEARPGDDAKSLFHIGDVIFDVSITPNRGDLLSHLGISRELKGLYPESVLHMPTWLRQFKQDNEWTEDFGEISLPDKGCYAYRLGLVTGAKIKNSPLTSRIDLVHLGMRPISNAVDVTNYVMLMLGQPLHAFDLNTLPAREITVRSARAGEIMRTLDGKDRNLTENDMLITSGGEAIALAGVMGGEQTGINENTNTILIESASFSAVRVGHTSRRLGINSEAAFRFSRTVDPALSNTALIAASALMRDWCEGEINYRPKFAENEIKNIQPVELTRKKLNVYLSFDDMNAASKILDGFGIKNIKDDHENKIFMPPTWRPDITIEEDLIEEIGRYRGYNEAENKLPGELPRRADVGDVMKISGFIRNFMMAKGFTEIMTYSFLPEDFAKKLKLNDTDTRSDLIKIANPISRDHMAMRTSLIPGLLNALKNSLASGWKDQIKIFEQGRIFLREGENNHIEPEHLAGLIFNGLDDRSAWNDRSEDFYNLKSVVENLIKSRGYTPEFKTGHENFTHAGQTANIFIDGVKIGFIARLKPALEQEININANKIYIFEIDTGFLINLKSPEFLPVSTFPASTRDISMLVSRDKNYAKVISDIKNSAGEDVKILTEIRLFDIYEGKGVPENFRSLAFTLTYRSRDRTLRDEEVENINLKIRENLNHKGYIIR